MSERKNIDTLFQEKFKDFEVTPNEVVWASIDAKLNEKKKRRIVPFWWKLSGVAAIFFMGFLIGKSVTTTKINTQTPVVTNTDSKSSNTKEVEKNSENKVTKDTPISSENTVVNHEIKVKNNTVLEKENKGAKIVNKPEKTIAANSTLQSRYPKNKVILEKNKARINKSVLEKSSNQLAENKGKEDSATVEKIAENTYSSTNIKTINLDELKEDSISNSKIVTQEKKGNDTTKIASVTPNALEELLNEKESKTKGLKGNRWQIASNVAPVFLGSVSKGSPIDPMFKDNTKHYNTNISVGLGITYALNTKLSIRTAINKMSYDYDTDDIIFFADIQNPGITNISPSATGKTIRVENMSAENIGLLPFENAFTHKNEGYINQRMGYLEVPLELTYKVVNKRLGITVISGVSTFILNENKISVISGNMSTDLGKANNLNDVHFSTNLGLGIKYGFWKSFEFNVEPTFKYQVNTFSSNAGNFKPYLFGVYSGISYQF